MVPFWDLLLCIINRSWTTSALSIGGELSGVLAILWRRGSLVFSVYFSFKLLQRVSLKIAIQFTCPRWLMRELFLLLLYIISNKNKNIVLRCAILIIFLICAFCCNCLGGFSLSSQNDERCMGTFMILRLIILRRWWLLMTDEVVTQVTYRTGNARLMRREST